jgi:hypothetical protein
MEGPAASPSARQKFRPVAKVWPGTQPETHSAIQQDEAPWRFGHELALLAVLFLLAASSRAWLIGHTEVAARDSVGFIRYALELERYPWKEVLERSLQHPGYPMVLLAVSWPVRHFLGETNSVSMQLSAQLASALAGVLLIIPMYYLGRDLFGRRAGFWGTALFQCLPVSARVMSDALSEATFLLFTATALLLAVRALRGQSAARFAWCGLFSGLAYLTRPEGALIVVATSLVLIAMQFVSSCRQSWPRVFVCGTALLVTAAAIGSPYVLVTGRLTNKPTPRRLWETAVSEETPKQGGARECDLQSNGGSGRSAWPLGGSAPRSQTCFPPRSQTCFPPRSQTPVWERSGGPLTASVLAIYAPENLKDRRLWGLYAIATEVTKDFQYLCVLPLLLGLWRFRDRLKTGGGWVLLVLCLLQSFILWRLAVVVGYVSDRHVLVLVLCGVFVAAGGVFVIGEFVARCVHRLRSGSTAGSVPFVESSKLSVVLFLTLMGVGLHEALKPLHANRAGHRQAGLWLAEHTELADPVADPFCWAHYYAGRVFWEGLTPPAPPGYIPTQYVVLERSPSSDHSRLPTIDHAKALAARGHVVYHWPVEKTEEEAKILVYAVPPH